jgi:hypothetical protein
LCPLQVSMTAARGIFLGCMPESNPPDHVTDVRRRRGAWTARCSCGWSQEVQSGFLGWSATRRHLDRVSGAARKRPAPSETPQVRVIGEVGDRDEDRHDDQHPEQERYTERDQYHEPGRRRRL